MPGVIIGNCLMYSWKKNYWLCENVTNIGVALQNVIPALNQPNVNFNFKLIISSKNYLPWSISK